MTKVTIDLVRCCPVLASRFSGRKRFLYGRSWCVVLPWARCADGGAGVPPVECQRLGVARSARIRTWVGRELRRVPRPTAQAMGGCYDRSTSQRINALVVDSARPSLVLLALPVHSTGRCICISARSERCAMGQGTTGGGGGRSCLSVCGGKEEGSGCRGHFERPTRCAFNAAWGASLNITWLMRSARRPLILAVCSAGCCIRACYVMWLPPVCAGVTLAVGRGCGRG